MASVVSYLLLLPLAAVGARRVVARRPPARGALAAGSVGRDRRSRVLSAGAVPDSRDRSGADRVRGRRLRRQRVREHSSMKRPRRRADLQRAREPAAARPRRARARRVPHAGRRRRIARRHRRDRRRAGGRVPGPGRGHAPHRPARPRPLVHRRPAAAIGMPGARSHLPDGRRPLARPRVPAGADRRGRDGRRRDRLALPARRQRRELAAAPHLPEHLRQPVHPGRDPVVGERLHQRLPLLAARGARAAAARRDGLGRLRVPGRDAVRGGARRLPDRRSADHLRRAPPGAVEAVVGRAPRVAHHAVAPGAPRRPAPDPMPPRRRDGDDVVPEIPGRQRRHLHGADRQVRSRRAATRSISSRRGTRSSRAAPRSTASTFISTGTRRFGR